MFHTITISHFQSSEDLRMGVCLGGISVGCQSVSAAVKAHRLYAIPCSMLHACEPMPASWRSIATPSGCHPEPGTANCAYESMIFHDTFSSTRMHEPEPPLPWACALLYWWEFCTRVRQAEAFTQRLEPVGMRTRPMLQGWCRSLECSSCVFSHPCKAKVMSRRRVSVHCAPHPHPTHPPASLPKQS